jgi:hypothetical protein
MFSRGVSFVLQNELPAEDELEDDDVADSEDED